MTRVAHLAVQLVEERADVATAAGGRMRRHAADADHGDDPAADVLAE
jgi:hypothetical protein